MITDFHENDILTDDDKKDRELPISREQYLMIFLYYMAADKTLQLVPPTSDHEQLFREVHNGPFGAHLRETKVHGLLCKYYWWKTIRTDIRKRCSGCLVCATRRPSRATDTSEESIPSDGSGCNSVP